MVIPSQLKVIPSSPHALSIKTPPHSSSSSLATSMKLKTLIHNCIFSHLFRVAQALTKAKTIIMELLKEIHLNNVHFLEPLLLKKNKNKNKLYFGSFRLHYNWCSSHVVPMTSSSPFNGHVYYESTWNSFLDEMAPESQLSGYLQCLEEKNTINDHGKNNGSGMTVNEMNEIDRLADKFIANCHEKFRLEKQESYRRFQEMMARSV